MAFTIDWELDVSEELTADSLLGNINLSDDKQSMLEKSVYLDSWIEALLTAAQLTIEPNSEAKVEIIEESHPLRIRRDEGNAYHLHFRDKEVVAESQAILKSSVNGAAVSFVQQTSSLRDALQNKTLDHIRKLTSQAEGDSPTASSSNASPATTPP